MLRGGRANFLLSEIFENQGCIEDIRLYLRCDQQQPLYWLPEWVAPRTRCCFRLRSYQAYNLQLHLSKHIWVMGSKNTYLVDPPVPISRRLLIVDAVKWVQAATEPIFTMNSARSPDFNLEKLSRDKSLRYGISIKSNQRELEWSTMDIAYSSASYGRQSLLSILGQQSQRTDLYHQLLEIQKSWSNRDAAGRSCNKSS